MDTATEAGTLGDRAYVGPSLATQDAIFTSLKKAETPVLRQVRRVIMEGVTGHKTLEMIAKQLHDYFSPWFTFRRAPMGGKLRANRVGAVNRWPGSSGMASQHVRTTMLTTSTAQHAAAVRGYARRNTEGMQWHLAPGHVDADDCDTHARADVGYGQGIYLPDEAPDLPSHFRCRCHYESVPL